jgi:hypothetical protein
MESSSHSQKKTFETTNHVHSYKSTNRKGNISHMLHGAGIFTYIWVIYGANVGKYSIHGASGIGKERSIFSLRHFPTEHLPPLFSPL